MQRPLHNYLNPLKFLHNSQTDLFLLGFIVLDQTSQAQDPQADQPYHRIPLFHRVVINGPASARFTIQYISHNAMQPLHMSQGGDLTSYAYGRVRQTREISNGQLSEPHCLTKCTFCSMTSKGSLLHLAPLLVVLLKSEHPLQCQVFCSF